MSEREPDSLPEGLFVTDVDDVDLDDAWGDEVSPEEELQHARLRVRIRGVVFGLLTVLAVLSLLMTTSELAYFLQIGQDPLDLGCLRARRTEGQEVLDVPSNRYVSLANQVMTYEAESDHYEYFFDPLYNIITRTEKPLPAKRMYRTVEVPEELVWLVENRLAFAEDLTAGFSGEGRLLRADQAPRRARAIFRAYSDIVRLPPEEVYLFLEGETPRDYLSYAIAYGIAAAIIFLTGLFFLRSLRVYRRLRDQD